MHACRKVIHGYDDLSIFLYDIITLFCNINLDPPCKNKYYFSYGSFYFVLSKAFKFQADLYLMIKGGRKCNMIFLAALYIWKGWLENNCIHSLWLMIVFAM